MKFRWSCFGILPRSRRRLTTQQAYFLESLGCQLGPKCDHDPIHTRPFEPGSGALWKPPPWRKPFLNRRSRAIFYAAAMVLMTIFWKARTGPGHRWPDFKLWGHAWPNHRFPLTHRSKTWSLPGSGVLYVEADYMRINQGKRILTVTDCDNLVESGFYRDDWSIYTG